MNNTFTYVLTSYLNLGGSLQKKVKPDLSVYLFIYFNRDLNLPLLTSKEEWKKNKKLLISSNWGGRLVIFLSFLKFQITGGGGLGLKPLLIYLSLKFENQEMHMETRDRSRCDPETLCIETYHVIY